MRCVATTPHKTFNRQADYVGPGSACSNIQTSNIIRSCIGTECNGHTYPPGRLRDLDMEMFGELPKHLHGAIIRETQDKEVILYRFQHRQNKKLIVHGYLVTDPKTHELLDFAICGNSWKSPHVLKWCAKYVSFSDIP